MDTIIQITLGFTAILLIASIAMQAPAGSISNPSKRIAKAYAHKSTSVLQKGTWMLGLALVFQIVLTAFI